MDGSSLIVVVMPITTLIILFTGIALPFTAASRSSRSPVRRRPPKPGAGNAAPAGFLYVPCARIRYHGYPAETRRWVQQVPIVKKTAKLIYYTSDSWDRREAVVSPGCISREQFETDTRCRDDRKHCPHGEDRCRHGYPAGVIPVPGGRHRPGPAGRLFFATREAAEADLYRGECERAEQAVPEAPPLRELRRAMADAHPDRGGTAEQFIQARCRYQTALRHASRVSFGVTDGVNGLVCLRWDAGDLRVGAAHLGQGVKLVSTRGRLCRVGAEQGERILGAQLVPHRLDLDGGIDQAGIPQQRDHLTEDANRPPGLGRLAEHGTDRLPEPSGIGPIGDHEAAYRLACVKPKVRTARRSRSHIDADVGKVSLEEPAVIWRGHHDRHAAFLDSGEKMLTYPLGEFLLVTVKQDDMAAAPDIEDLGPGSHGVSRPSAVTIQLISYAASCDGQRMDRHLDMQYHRRTG
jgi:hypothetical protein